MLHVRQSGGCDQAVGRHAGGARLLRGCQRDGLDPCPPHLRPRLLLQGMDSKMEFPTIH